MPTCALCLANVASLADSHVYPLALHKKLHAPDMPAFTVFKTPVHPARTAVKSRSGTHGYFVCHRCERDAFQDGDNAFMTLYGLLDANPPEAPDGGRGIVVPGDPGLIHRFAIQTLWRWFACPGIQLDPGAIGPLYERIRGWLLTPGGTLRTGWGVAVQHTQGEMSLAALPPAVVGRRGCPRSSFIVFAVPRFIFYIAADRCWLPGNYAALSLRNGPGVNMVVTKEVPRGVVEAFAHVFGESGLERTEQYVARFQAKKS